MREILFRGKRSDNGKWVEGELLHDMQNRPHLYWKTPKELPIVFSNNAIVGPNTLGQFTGLIDKNGKKIFEGDIVKVTDDYGETNFSDGGIGDVEFYDGSWYISGEVHNGLNDLTKVYYVEVIGNIHDNAELKEVK